MNKRIFFITLIIITSWCIKSSADVYEYVDENGIIHYTNIPVDKGYTKIISGKTTSGYKDRKSSTANPEYYHQIITSKSKAYNIEPDLVKAVIKAESNWNPDSVSKKGAIGLMQLMPFTAQDMGVKNPFNPEENIEGGIKYLRYLLDKFNDDLHLALAAYNAGPKKIEKFGGIPPISETKNYVKRVLSLYTDNKRPAPIYKVHYNEGTVLYTNIPVIYKKHNPSRF